MRRLLAEEETAEGSTPPVVIKHMRPGPKHPAYGIPASEWPTVVQPMVSRMKRSVAFFFMLIGSVDSKKRNGTQAGLSPSEQQLFSLYRGATAPPAQSTLVLSLGLVAE